jgi:tRNA threonylcarbamoyladenosine biosynthesis protein TsaB
MTTGALLAIETSQRRGGIALRDLNGDIDVEYLAEARRHDDDLLPAIDRVLRRCATKPQDISAVGVSIGPGGFTGLRIAVSTAKVFGTVLGARLLAVPTALVVAESVERDDPGDREMLVALATKGDTFWATRLRPSTTAGWTIFGDPGLEDSDACRLDDVSLVLGDAYLPEALRARCQAADIGVREPRFEAAACLAVAERMLERGEVTDPIQLRPLYPREPEAVSLWRRRPSGSG